MHKIGWQSAPEDALLNGESTDDGHEEEGSEEEGSTGDAQFSESLPVARVRRKQYASAVKTCSENLTGTCLSYLMNCVI